MNIISFDPKTFQGMIPDGHDIVIYERGGNPNDGYVLYDFSELGMFDRDFKDPVYAFVK